MPLPGQYPSSELFETLFGRQLSRLQANLRRVLQQNLLAKEIA